MRIALFTDGLSHLSRREAFRFCADRGIRAVELGMGVWSPPKGHIAASYADDELARQVLQEDLDDFRISLVAINGAGNPLHPDPAERKRADRALRGAIRLAGQLRVPRVIAMSGSPGARSVEGPGQVGVFSPWALVPDDEGLWQWQFEEVVVPYWSEISEFAVRHAPDALVCLELHPGCTVFNVDTFNRLRTHTGKNIAVNVDPSHLWWQGMDPGTVALALTGSIGFAHAKDTMLYPARIARDGVLGTLYPIDRNRAPWHFAGVGAGHDTATWRSFLRALREAGYDDAISIEHEDPEANAESAISTSADVLRQAIRDESATGV
jgi:sugar phosphate isomerase/epimerase